MATVFMRWLETTPVQYDRAIHLLTLGKLNSLYEQIATHHVQPGDRVLDLGCGTGSLAILLARRGARVTAVDASPRMLGEARRKVLAEGLADRVELLEIDASMLARHLPGKTFDVIVSTLMFSELSVPDRELVLGECRALLAPEGRLIIGDEAVPEAVPARLAYGLVRLALLFITWLLTRATTSRLRRLRQELENAGFRVESEIPFAPSSLQMLVAGAQVGGDLGPKHEHPQLRHRVTLLTRLTDVWCLLFRVIPPYPKVRTGLYRIGEPGRASPVLVTGNFDLTVRRLVRAIEGQVDAWLVVADSAGINVWCGAGGGYFTAQKIIATMNSSGVAEVVDHRQLVLPQLAANGVHGRTIERETGWRVKWGPVRADDIPAYLEAGAQKTDAMRWIAFPLKDRLEMVTVTLGLYALMLLLPVAIFWRSLFWPVTMSLVGLSYFYATALPWLPGRDGLLKSIPLTIMALAGLLVYTTVGAPLPLPRLFNWAIGLAGLSIFTAAELQGMSPLMRGEQANWVPEAAIAVILGLLYWLGPLAAGWR